MIVARPVPVLCAALLLIAAHPALGHEPVAVPGGGAMSAAVSHGEEVSLNVIVDPAARLPAVVVVPRGARVRLSLDGAGEGELHLHGYDIAVRAEPSAPALIVFDAAHPGRFPVEMHVEDALLGRHAKPILYIEVREP